MEWVYLTKNDLGEVRVDTTLEGARRSAELLTEGIGACAWFDELPRSLFKSLEEKEVIKTFDIHRHRV